MIKLSDYVISFFQEKGIEHVFLLVGGGAMHLNDSLAKNKKIKHVCALHEQAAAIAAEAYSRYSENFGVAIVTTGPGGTNTVTGVAGCWSDSIPCFFVSGQVKRSDLIGHIGLRINGFQEVEIIKVVKPITKYAETVMEPEMIRYNLEKAYHIMLDERPGPVWLDIPVDIQATMIDEKRLPGFDPSELSKPKCNVQQIRRQAKQALNILLKAKRPVILAGNGIRLSHGVDEFRKLIGKLRIPILTTWGAVDLIEDEHPQFFGRPNTLGGNRAASFIIQNSDVLLTIGARLGVQQIGDHLSFAREAKLIMVDIDEKELLKPTLRPFLSIKSDARLFIREISNQCKERQSLHINSWIEYCQKMKKRYPIVLPEYFKEEEFVNSYVFVDILSEELQSDDVIVPSSSATAYVCTSQAFRLKKGQRFLTSRGMASMGWDLPSAIGACFASGGKRTICVTGDGSIQLNLQEMQTIISNKLPIKIFVLNNKSYLSTKTIQKAYFSRLVGCNAKSGLVLPDLIKIAKAYGYTTELIRVNAEVRQKIRKVLQTPGPVFCEIFMSADQPVIPKLSTNMLKNGTMVSRPLEDMYPLLDRKEFLENMIIKPYKQ
jgi:acetolactate synthase-1/2/3 large subunit